MNLETHAAAVPELVMYFGGYEQVMFYGGWSSGFGFWCLGLGYFVGLRVQGPSQARPSIWRASQISGPRVIEGEGT